MGASATGTCLPVAMGEGGIVPFMPRGVQSPLARHCYVCSAVYAARMVHQAIRLSWVVFGLAALQGCGSDSSSPGQAGAVGGSGGSADASASGGSAGAQTGGAGGSAGTGGSGGASAGGAAGSGGATGGAGGSGGSVTPNQSCTSPSPPFTALEQQLVDLPADSWYDVPDSKMRAVCPTGYNCANAIEPWSGGTYDPVHNQMLIFGGGHSDYAGNEVYSFDMATLKWTRLTDPSSQSYASQDPLPDGQPVSRHTYDGIAYVAHADAMFVHGGSRWQDGGGTNVTWAFDPVAKAWTDRQPSNELPLTNCCSEGSAYDPATKRVYVHRTKSLAAYDWDTNSWVVLQDYGNPPFWPRYEAWGDKRGVVDTKRGLLWFLGSKLVLVYDIAHGTHVTDDWITTGGTTFTNAPDVSAYPEEVITTGGGEVITANGPGVDYDTAADDLVAWIGGAPWVLDLESKVWSQASASGAPTTTAAHGTFGRWRYVPRLNVFVLVNGADQDVLVYKHTAGCGTP